MRQMKQHTSTDRWQQVVPQAQTIRTLYLCYFGLREPLVQTQVIPYLLQLAAAGIHVNLVTFEPKFRENWSAHQLSQEGVRLAQQGINWFYLPYHKRPSLPATLFDVAAGARLASRLIRTEGVNVIHARSHVPALMGAIAKWTSGGCLIFDVRGFMPEEYTDGGVWPEGGLLYRWTKFVERRLFSASDAFVVLTEKARDILFPGCSAKDQLGRPLEVIPCCVDPVRFSPMKSGSRDDARKELHLTCRRVIVYIGSLGGWYLTDEMATFLSVAHEQDAATFSMILTQSDPSLISKRLIERGVPEEHFFVRNVNPAEVPRYLAAADIGLSFIKQCYSKLSSSPTKIAEYLASGLPVVSTAGIGDLDEILQGDQVGIIVSEFSREHYLKVIKALESMRLDRNLADRCRATAWKRFDLERVGGRRYLRLYGQILGSEKTRMVQPE